MEARPLDSFLRSWLPVLVLGLDWKPFSLRWGHSELWRMNEKRFMEKWEVYKEGLTMCRALCYTDFRHLNSSGKAHFPCVKYVSFCHSLWNTRWWLCQRTPGFARKKQVFGMIWASSPCYYVHFIDMVERCSPGPWGEILDIWFRSLLGSSPPRVSNPIAN